MFPPRGVPGCPSPDRDRRPARAPTIHVARCPSARIRAGTPVRRTRSRSTSRRAPRTVCGTHTPCRREPDGKRVLQGEPSAGSARLPRYREPTSSTAPAGPRRCRLPRLPTSTETRFGSPRDLVTGFKNRLDHFRAAARAGAAYALCAPAMMRPQLASRDVQDWLGDSPAQARFQGVEGQAAPPPYLAGREPIRLPL